MISTETYIVAFVDILGFSDFIKKYDNGEMPNVLSDIKNASDSAADFLKMNISQNEHDMFNWKKDFVVKLFSDCLCAAIPINTNYQDFFYNFLFFNLYISTYQNLLMEKGFFSRGAISFGSFYSDENMIFSGALVESVELEKKAIFPRILISPKLLSEIEQHPEKDSKILSELLVVDENQNVFVNNFNIEKCTNLMTQDSIEKIKENNPGHAEDLIAGFSKVKDFQVQENKEFKQAIKSKIKRNLVHYKSDKRIFDKYFWIKQLYEWNYSKTKRNNKFRKYNQPITMAHTAYRN